MVQSAPDITVVIVEGAAVVAGRRLAVLVGGVHAVRFVWRGLYIGVVEGPRLAFRTNGCVGEVAGVDRTRLFHRLKIRRFSGSLAELFLAPPYSCSVSGI